MNNVVLHGKSANDMIKVSIHDPGKVATYNAHGLGYIFKLGRDVIKAVIERNVVVVIILGNVVREIS